MQGVSKSGRKCRGQEIDVQLQIAAVVTAEDNQVAAVVIAGADQVKAYAPRIPELREIPGFPPAQMWRIIRFHQVKSARGGRNFRSQFKGIKIIGIERSRECAADLLEAFCDFEFLSRTPDREVIDEDVSLLDGPLRDPSNFAKFKVAEMLHTDPDASPEHSQDQSQRAACGPQQKKAQQGENR